MFDIELDEFFLDQIASLIIVSIRTQIETGADPVKTARACEGILRLCGLTPAKAQKSSLPPIRQCDGCRGNLFLGRTLPTMGESWPGGRKMIQQFKMICVRTPAYLTLMFFLAGIFGATTAGAEELKYVEANGITFALSGRRAKGRWSSCFHGYPENRPAVGLPCNRAIAGAGYRVVAPFTRGYPPTTASDTGDYSVRALGQDALALIDALGEESAILIGHDWGASTVYEATTANPSKVTKLVALSVPHARAVADDPAIFLEAPHFLYYQLPFIREWVGHERLFPTLMGSIRLGHPPSMCRKRGACRHQSDNGGAWCPGWDPWILLGALRRRSE